jgi:hypothetical protein
MLLLVRAVVNPEAIPKKQRWASVAIWLGAQMSDLWAAQKMPVAQKAQLRSKRIADRKRSCLKSEGQVTLRHILF